MGSLLSSIGRYDRNPPAEYRPNAGQVLPVALGIKRNFPLHKEACNDQLRLISVSITELIREGGGYSRINEALPNIVAAILVAPSITALGFNAVSIMKLIHGVKPLTEAAWRHDHIDKFREILLDCLRTLSSRNVGPKSVAVPAKVKGC